MARPRSTSPAVELAIVARVAAGEKLEAVALDVGLSGQTVRRMMRAAGYLSQQRTVWIQRANPPPTPTPET